jgi:predicted nucleotidyltransferase component of viral defense system
MRVSFVFFPFRNVRRTERFEGIPVASDYDIYLNKIYAAGRRVEPKDAVDFVFLTRTYRWPWDRVKKDFEQKFPDQTFEIFLGAMLHEEDYPGLSEETRSALRAIAQEVKAWRMDSG